MTMDVLVRQLILLVVAVAVPAVLLILRREKALLVWVGASLFVQTFDTAIVTNLPAGRIVGLVYLPMVIAALPRLIANRNFRYASLSLVYVGILGIVFGFIFPWPDTTGHRPFTFRAEGKSIVYFIRMSADLSLAAFIYLQNRREKVLVSLRRGLIAGAVLTSLVGAFESLSGIDVYVLITGLGREHPGAQGLSYEPRGLGLAAVWGFFLIFLPARKISIRSLILGLLCVAGLVASGSFSAVALFVAGTVVALWTGLGGSHRRRPVLVGLTISILATGAWLAGGQLRSRVAFYLDPQNRLRGTAQPSNFLEEVVFRLDVFDAASLAFLAKNPTYALIGTGPGLVCLPASAYIPPGAYSSIWTPEDGINSPPTLGLLVEIANGGLIALGLWLIQVAVAFRRTFASRRVVPRGWTASEWVFLGRFLRFGVVFYVVQNSVSPVWAIVTGCLFIAADFRALRYGKTVPSTPSDYHEPRLREPLAPMVAFDCVIAR